MDTLLTVEHLMLKAKQSDKFERILEDSMEHKAAEGRFDLPNLTTDRTIVFGPEHRVITAASPRKDASVLDLGDTYIGQAEYDDDN